MSKLQFNKVIEADNADQAFTAWWECMLPTKCELDNPSISRDGEVVSEVINAITVIKDPTRSFMLNPIREMPTRYAIGEFLWYLHGNNDLKSIQLYTHNWDRMSDSGSEVNSNYGWCIKQKYGFNQYKSVLRMLREDLNTRQAVIHIKEPQEFIGKQLVSKDVNCTVCLQFFVRDMKLHMTTYMRSNDLWLGFPFDIFQFMNLQVLLCMDLSDLGVTLGTYTHHAGSFHLYKRDYIKGIEKMSKASEKLSGPLA